MMEMHSLNHFQHIWVFDWEYVSDPGESPDPVCMVAIDLVTGRRIRRWRNELQPCPFETDPASLFVCFSGTGDIGCFLACGWPVPARIVDLYPEIRQLFYDRAAYTSASLINAAAEHGIPTMESADKDAARDLIIHRRFTDDDRDYLLDYCEADVAVTADLFQAMCPSLTASTECWNGVLQRGRYTAATARMEATGVPLDMVSLDLVRKHWDAIKLHLIREVDQAYGVYSGATFKAAAFDDYLAALGIPWPRLDSGPLALDDDTFRQMARSYPQLAELRELRHALGEMRLSSYTVGRDGRNRVFLNPYGSVTGRNQPSNSRFIFGSARWMRSFIKPSPGRAVIYADWSNQEMAINAALSGDAALWQAYETGDPYLAFAIQCGLAPAGATKATHKAERQRAKGIVLGVGYGMGAESLALSAGIGRDEARELLARHRDTYRQFWQFVANVQDAGSLGEKLLTRFHWTRRIKPGVSVNRRSLQNWPAQANGAEMMRLACSRLTELGVAVCCPVHDALLVECDIADIATTTALTCKEMGDASELVLGKGKRVRVEVDVVAYPDRYRDENAGEMWAKVMRLAQVQEDRSAANPRDDRPERETLSGCSA
jgi:hypothetical protein